MNRSDWIGVGSSVLLHGLLAFLFTTMTMATDEPVEFGYVEVEFGPWAEGQPVQQAEEPEPEAPRSEPQPRPEPEETEVEPQEQPSTEESSPVELPEQEQIPDPEQVDSPEEEVIGAEDANDPEEESASGAGDGQPEGSSGEDEGEDGSGETEEASAPFEIEGLDRNMVYSTLPEYREKVNVDIEVRITVNPQGRVVGVVPLIRGNPALERAVHEALQQWRFDRLPPNAPQENQTGTVTFRFRLE